jgi:hypothetical protein
VDLVHRLWTNTGTRSTMDQGPGASGAGHRAGRRCARHQLVARGLTAWRPRGRGELGDFVLVVTGWWEAVEPDGLGVERRRRLVLSVPVLRGTTCHRNCMGRMRSSPVNYPQAKLGGGVVEVAGRRSQNCSGGGSLIMARLERGGEGLRAGWSAAGPVGALGSIL